MNSFIEFENVSFSYRDEDEGTENKVIENLSLSVEKGDFVCVLGHNGCGKSTTAKLCNAILIPQSGRVLVDGIDTKDEAKINDIRRKVGMVFQNPDNQIVATIVEDDVAFGPENLGIEPKEIRRRVDEALKSVNMYEHRLRQPHNLSGGQKQRVAIAGVLSMQTDCIVLDEPTAMLDPVGRAEVLQTVKRLNKELGITVIMVTHFMDEAVEADRVVVMSSGEIVMDGTPQQVFSDIEKVRAYGLDVPQSTALCAALSIKENVLNAQQCVDVIDRICGGAK